MRALDDADGRVRANAVDALRLRLIREPTSNRPGLAQLLGRRGDCDGQRERANTAVALARLDAAAGQAVVGRMLADARPVHRISGLWAAEQIGGGTWVEQAGRLARTDVDARVRHAAAKALRRQVGVAA
jgi:hypothetical protein